jgi:hypothetical protein
MEANMHRIIIAGVAIVTGIDFIIGVHVDSSIDLPKLQNK